MAVKGVATSITRSSLMVKYSTPENLGDSINTKTFEGDPYIAPDENFLILTAYNRSDGLGDGDLYISLNRDGHWTPGEKSG